MQRVPIDGARNTHTAMLRGRGEGSRHSGGRFNKGIDADLGDHGLERPLGHASGYPKSIHR